MNMTPSSAFTVNEVLSASWAMTKKHWTSYLLLGVLAFVVNLAFGIVFAILDAIISLPQIVSSLFSMVIGVYVGIVVIRGYLAIGREQKLDFSMLTKWNGKMYLQMLLATFLFYLAVMGGFILLIVPGIIASIMFGFYAFTIVDKDADAVPALTDSKDMTAGSRNAIFLFGLALFGVAMVAIGGPAIIMMLVAFGAANAGIPGLIVGLVMIVGVVYLVVAAVLLSMVGTSARTYMYLKLRAKHAFHITN